MYVTVTNNGDNTLLSNTLHNRLFCEERENMCKDYRRINYSSVDNLFTCLSISTG